MAEFVTPQFLQNSSPEDIWEKMVAVIPDDIDLSDGNHAWNHTYPTALALGEFYEFYISEAIRVMLPEWSYGDYLDGHANARGMSRRAATAANGEITITGAEGSIIPRGSLFSTASINDAPSIDYATVEEVTIPASGEITVTVECTQLGLIGNTPSGTVIIAASRLTGVTAVVNADDITGGVEEEPDESLQLRILDYDRSQGESFTGCPSDYKRWAMSVPGVGGVVVVPATDDSGLVRLIVTDMNGDPATETLCENVYNYIMSPDDENKRLTNVNTLLSVEPPATMEIGVSATVELESDATVESVTAAFATNLALYLPEAMEDHEIKLSRIEAVLSDTVGVYDRKDVRIGVKSDGAIAYGTGNIPIDSMTLPEVSTADIVLTAGTV